MTKNQRDKPNFMRSHQCSLFHLQLKFLWDSLNEGFDAWISKKHDQIANIVPGAKYVMFVKIPV
jgi:hypothetical protein